MIIWGVLLNPNLVRIEICASDFPGILRKLNKSGIVLRKVEYIDELTIRAVVLSGSVKSIALIVKRCGGDFRVIRKSPVNRFLREVPKRICLIICVFLLVLLTVLIPQRILFVKVVGGSSIPDTLIIDCAEEYGLSFGTKRRDIRSEDIKNALIGRLSMLEWVGVNTSGCVAEISVREKRINNESKDTKQMISNIVAERDGVIIAQTIIEGTPVCRVGDAVIAEQLLVSAYTDCGRLIQVTSAEAEILARTKRRIDTVTPLYSKKRSEIIDHWKRYSILCRKKLINLYKDSGISHGSCVKICKQKYLKLPGDFVLPIALITEEMYAFRTYENVAEDVSWMADFSGSYLQAEMIAGQIISGNVNLAVDGEIAKFSGEYDCIEMIGKRKIEENIYRYGATN